MELFAVDPETRVGLEELAVRGRQRVPPWWQAHADVISANYAEFLAYESEAVRCLEFQPLLLPAQVQTEDYARAVTGVGFAALGPDQVDSLVEVRMRRQDRLREKTDPLILDCVVTEAALRILVGGHEVMRHQLDHLLEISQLPHVSFRVVPLEAGEKAAITGAFTLFGNGKDADGDVAFLESADGTTFRDEPLTLRRLNRLFRNLTEASLTASHTLELVDRIKRELT